MPWNDSMKPLGHRSCHLVPRWYYLWEPVLLCQVFVSVLVTTTWVLLKRLNSAESFGFLYRGQMLAMHQYVNMILFRWYRNGQVHWEQMSVVAAMVRPYCSSPMTLLLTLRHIFQYKIHVSNRAILLNADLKSNHAPGDVVNPGKHFGFWKRNGLFL